MKNWRSVALLTVAMICVGLLRESGAVLALSVVLATVGMALAWRAGADNLGGEGQFVAGGLFPAFLAFQGWGVSAPVLVLAGATAGAGLALLATVLRNARRVPLVLSTLLISMVMAAILNAAVLGPLQEPDHALPQTAPLPESLRMSVPNLVMIGGALVIATAIVATRTAWGFLNLAAGRNPDALRASSVDPETVVAGSMALSGGFCGLAGATLYIGAAHVIDAFSFANGMTFSALAFALLARLDPWRSVLVGVIGAYAWTQFDAYVGLRSWGAATTPLLQGLLLMLLAMGRSRRWSN